MLCNRERTRRPTGAAGGRLPGGTRRLPTGHVLVRMAAAVGLAAWALMAPLGTPQALAAAPAAAPKSLEERVTELEKKAEGGALGFLRGIKIGTNLATSYVFNFNEPPSHANDFRVFDVDTNSFELDLVQLSLDKAAEPVGFRIDLDYGRIAHHLGLATQNDLTGLFGRNDDVEVQQAFIAFKPDVFAGLTVKGGKFVTLAGAEVIEPNLNYTFSRSFLFGFVPFTNTGLRASYGAGPVTATVGVVNGWDVTSDNNRGKTIEGQIAFAPSDMLSVALTGYYGAELSGLTGPKRTLGDLVVVVKPLPGWVASLNYDAIYDEDISPTNSASAFSHGLAVTLHYDLTSRIGLTARGEYFRDEDNAKVPAGTKSLLDPLSPAISTISATRGATLYEGTATISYKVVGPAEVRVEYRYDGSTQNLFESDEGVRDHQHTITGALLVSF